jgi:UDP-glucose 4-epimerase
MTQNVLITGHKGFIGQHVFADWQETHGGWITGLDRPDDVRDFSGGDYDLVIHLAAYADIRDSQENPEKYYENNVASVRPLFEWCRKTNTRLLYASSSAVEEGYWGNPYAMTKWINEQMAPPNSVGMRFTTVYGPGGRGNMMYDLLKDKKATYVTNHKRDWIHVKDVCRAIRYLASSDVTGPVTIGTGESVAVKDLAKAFGQGHLPVLEDTPGERQDNVADISIMKSIGWFPTVDIFSTI